MPLRPRYGETLVSGEEKVALQPRIRDLLGDPIRKVDVYDLEQAVQEQVAEELVTAVLDDRLAFDDLLDDSFLRELHRRLYGDIWAWAGAFRKRELNIGIAPEMIAVELRSSLGTIDYRWRNTNDWSPRQLGIAAHADTVRIHPFTDGNGRTTRLFADLLFIAAQDGDMTLARYDWNLDRNRYIVLLQQYDQHRDPSDLAEFIDIRSLDE